MAQVTIKRYHASSDGSGVMVELDPSASTLKTGELIIGSGPSSAQMSDVVQWEILFM